MEKIFTVGDLRRLVEGNEFKPVLGNGVESGNKKINGEAYKEIEKETKSVYKNLGKAKKGNEFDNSDTLNQGMSDLRYDSISKPFKDKMASQMKGYTSAEAEKAHKKDEFGNADYGTDEQVKKAKEKAKNFKKGKDTAAEIGLTSQHLNKKDIESKTETMAENKKIKKLSFHKKFMTEGHMMSLIPDYLKEDGNRFIMKDSHNTEYLVEWDSHEPIVTKKVDMSTIKEQCDRIKQLFDYKNEEVYKNSTSKSRLAESTTSFRDTLNRARELMK